MKKILFLFLILLSCSRSEDHHALQKKILQKTDEDFSQMSMEKGMKQAFLYYAADEVIKMREGQDPLFGISELSRSLEDIPVGQVRLSWIPLKADVSGDLGYTFGKWELKIAGRDTTEYGTYVTVWKKQANGAWKYVLDAGNSTPKP